MSEPTRVIWRGILDDLARSRMEPYLAIERVRELHEPASHFCDLCDERLCAACSVPYPCPTIAALDGVTRDE